MWSSASTYSQKKERKKKKTFQVLYFNKWDFGCILNIKVSKRDMTRI